MAKADRTVGRILCGVGGAAILVLAGLQAVGFMMLQSISDTRYGFHNGWWFCLLLLCFGIILLSIAGSKDDPKLIEEGDLVKYEGVIFKVETFREDGRIILSSLTSDDTKMLHPSEVEKVN